MQAQELAAEWLAEKQKEQAANAARLAIEKKMLQLLAVQEEGSTTHNLQNGLKVKLTGKVKYKANLDLLKAITSSWPEEVRPIRARLEADEPLLRAIRHDRPDLWRVLSPAITLEPAKTYIVVEAIL